MRIAHFGTFDAENYGDLLFPLILERRLAGLCDEVVHVAPAGGPPVWKDCVPTVGFNEFFETPGNVDGVIIGGGQIVRTASTPLEVYDRGGVSTFTTYPSVWLGAAYVAARHDAPLCWNAPGVSPAFGPVASRLITWAASVTDYLAVRDETSRGSLEEAGVSRDIVVVPDSAAEVSGLWDEGEISAAYRKVFARHNRPVPGSTITFHVNSRWASEEFAAVATRIDRICKSVDATPILLAIGPCHGDGEIQRQVSRKMRADPLVIDRPQSLLEVTACIARSRAYLGSSLHGMIAAGSFGTRGVLVASREDGKYAGFLDHLDLSSWMVESWAEAEQRAGELFATPDDSWKRVLHPILPVLDEHWGSLREALLSNNGASPNDRQAAVEQLQHIGEDRYKNLHVFQPLIAEYLEETQARTKELSRRLRRERQKSRELGQDLRQERQKSKELVQKRQELREEQQKSRELGKDLMLLRRWMEIIDEAAQQLWASRQWKTGRTIGELRRRILRRPKRWGAREQLDSQLQRFRYWNEEFGCPKDSPGDR